MAEELEAGGVCGDGIWWLNSPRNLLFPGISPCSLDVFHDGILWPKTPRSSSPFDNSWDQDLGNGDGKTLGNYLQTTAMDSHTDSNSCKDYNQGLLNSTETGGSLESAPCYQLSSSSYTFSSSLLENLFDGDSSYMMNQDEYFGNLGMINSANILENRPENQFQFAGCGDFPAMLMPSDQPQFVPLPPEHTKRSKKFEFSSQNQREQTPPLHKSSMWGTKSDPIPKRQRIETPSPLPTFKVRKEKLGDRVTALQQLVSPFGKTDTASVLHEAIEYIKFLHDQVNVLSSPYFNTKSSVDQIHQTCNEGIKQGLRSRGLCLMPISISYPVATETSSGFWTPAFERNLRYTEKNGEKEGVFRI